jgi:hypothetical protein
MEAVHHPAVERTSIEVRERYQVDRVAETLAALYRELRD